MGMGAGATAYMVRPLKPAQDKGNASIQIADEDRDKINQEAVPGNVSAPEAPVVAAKPAETTTSPVTEPEAPVEPQAKPQTYKWAAEMTAAGIAAADHGYVTDMVLEDSGWRLVMRDKTVWHLARQTQGTLTEQLIQVNKYVESATPVPGRRRTTNMRARETSSAGTAPRRALPDHRIARLSQDCWTCKAIENVQRIGFDRPDFQG
jgi:hypothetical protein